MWWLLACGLSTDPAETGVADDSGVAADSADSAEPADTGETAPPEDCRLPLSDWCTECPTLAEEAARCEQQRSDPDPGLVDCGFEMCADRTVIRWGGYDWDGGTWLYFDAAGELVAVRVYSDGAVQYCASESHDAWFGEPCP